MEKLTILLPDKVSQQLLAEAAKQRVDPSALCSVMIADYLSSTVATTSVKPVATTNLKSVAVSTASISPSTTTKAFNVAEKFPGYPPRSIELAQQFVEEALRMRGTKAFKAFSGRGVGLEPNFVFVEYLLKRYPGGIGVSFYGSPERLGSSGLLQGRNPNYSRATARNEEELRPLLTLIRRSYELKHGGMH